MKNLDVRCKILSVVARVLVTIILMVSAVVLNVGCSRNGPITREQSGSKGATVRDHFWIWSHEAGVYNGQWGLPGDSRITPVEGAHYMGVSNIIFVRYEGKPSPPFDQYSVPFASMKQVNWSIAGANGATSDEEREQVLRLAAVQPNITGVFMDDFFHIDTRTPSAKDESESDTGAMTVEQLRGIRQRLNDINGRKLDLGVTLYTHQLDKRILKHIDFCDVVSLWTWKSEDLKDLEINFEKLKEMMPEKRIWLGCYMWDFGDSKPMSQEWMKKQCQLGLKWLRQGRIEGMIFLGTNICDLNLETVKWTRQWISQVGDEPLQ